MIKRKIVLEEYGTKIWVRVVIIVIREHNTQQLFNILQMDMLPERIFSPERTQ